MNHRSSFALAFLMSLSCGTIQPLDVTYHLKSTPIYLAYATVGASLYRFHNRIPDDKKPSYSLERLRYSFEETLAPEQQIITAVILGFDSAKKIKKDVDNILIGLYDATNKTIIATAKANVNIVKSEKKELLKQLTKLMVSDKPENVSLAIESAPDYWVKPEIYCSINIIALRPNNTTKLSYTLIDPQFIDLSDATTVEELITLKALETLYNSQEIYKENFLHEMLLVIDDGIIGHPGKSGSPKVNLKSKKLEAGSSVDAKGIFGKIHTMWTPMTLAAFAAKFVLTGQKDNDNNQNSSNNGNEPATKSQPIGADESFATEVITKIEKNIREKISDWNNRFIKKIINIKPEQH